MTRDRLRVILARYRDDDDGSIIVFVLIMFLLMVVAVGMAVDFMRHEAARADLQNALDRGLLATAALNQTWVDEEIAARGLPDTQEEREKLYKELVVAYMESRIHSDDSTIIDIQLTENASGRVVTGTATYEMPTFFLNLIGFPQITVPATSTAQQLQQYLEVALVLDVSGSMYNTDNAVSYTDDNDTPGDPSDDVTAMTTRIDILTREAKRFVDYIIEQDPSVDKSRTAVTIVPYSHQTGLPASMASYYKTFSPDPLQNGNDPLVHDRSFCMDFEPSAFTQTYIPTSADPTANADAKAYHQTRHFWWRDNRNADKVTGCVRDANTVLPFTSDTVELGAKIDNLEEENLTAIYQGVKWGATLLDPLTRPVISGLVTDGVVDAKFSGLPRDPAIDVKKVMIVISDGSNTYQPRIADDDYVLYAQNAGATDLAGYVDFWDTTTEKRGNGFSADDGGRTLNAVQAQYCDTTASNTTSNDRRVWRAYQGQYNSGSPRCIDPLGGVHEDGGSMSTADARLLEICAAAKDPDGLGTVIYAIGFDAGGRAQRALDECATAPEKSFVATGQDLRSSFEQIAADIFKLRLVN